MGVERPSFHCPGYIPTFSGPRGLRGYAPLVAVPVGVESSSPFEDQSVRLVPSKTTPDDEVLAAAHGLGLPRGVPAMCRGSGGLLAPILCLPPSPGGMASGGGRLPRGNFGVDILVVSRWHNIQSRS